MERLAMWFSGLRGKLLIMVVLPVVVMGISAVVAVNALEAQKHNNRLVGNDRMPKITTLLRLRINAEAAVRFLWATTGFDDLKIRQDKAENSAKRFKAFRDEYLKFMGFRNLDDTIKLSMSSMFEDWKQVENLSKTAKELLLVGDPGSDQQAKALLESELIPLYLRQIEIITEIEKQLQTQVDQTVIAAESSAQQAENTLVIMALISALSLFGVGFFIASYLANSLSKVTNQVHSAGSQVETAGEQLSTASQALSSGATQSASALEETVASLEELSSIVKMNADNAREAATLAARSTQSAETGEAEIRNLIAAMTDLSESSKKIEQIINVIDDLAFQTDLLALNAAVEAARAGDQGKGFAVVAEAVRNLAQRSASAAKDINGLIIDSVSKTDRGAKIADQSGTVLNEIVTSIKKVSDLNSEIASASAEQAKGISQISIAMNELDAATQTNAGSAEEVAASSEELAAQSISLQGLVGELRRVVEGSGSQKEKNARISENEERPSRRATKLRIVRGGRVSQQIRVVQSGDTAENSFEEDLMPVKKVGSTDDF